MCYFSTKQNAHVILASASEQRSAILTQMRITHSVLPTHIEELTDKSKLHDIVCDLAEQKALRGVELHTQDPSYAKATKPTLVIGADTIVLHENTFYGKPSSTSHARMMLMRLSGKTHEVYSGISVAVLEDYDHATNSPFEMHTCFDSARVSFARLNLREIEVYLESNEWFNVAGGYAIQGMAACFVERIEGLDSTVMGLPIRPLYDIIKDIL